MKNWKHGYWFICGMPFKLADVYALNEPNVVAHLGSFSPLIYSGWVWFDARFAFIIRNSFFFVFFAMWFCFCLFGLISIWIFLCTASMHHFANTRFGWYGQWFWNLCVVFSSIRSQFYFCFCLFQNRLLSFIFRPRCIPIERARWNK